MSLADELVVPNVARNSSHDELAAPWLGPKLVGVRFPTDPEEHNQLLFSAVEGHGDIFQMPHYFVPYPDVRAQVRDRGRSVDEIAKELRNSAEAVGFAVSRYANKTSSVRFLPLIVRKITALAVIDGNTGEMLGLEEIPRTN